jgi:TPR repeat protein
MQINNMQTPTAFSKILLKGIIGTLLSLTLFLPNLASAVTPCDREAGHGLDQDGVVAGVSRSAMDFDAAEKACRQAVADYPAHARSNYQLARVLYYSGKGKESLPFMQVSADAGYPQAIFVLGFIQTIEDQVPVNFCAAAALWTKSAALDHPWTGVYLPWEYLKGNFADCDITLSDADLLRLEQLAIQNIHYSESEGRVEAMQALLKEHLASKTTKH